MTSRDFCHDIPEGLKTASWMQTVSLLLVGRGDAQGVAGGP